MKHQLESNTYCVPSSAHEARAILRIASNNWLLTGGLTKDILNGSRPWPHSENIVRGVSYVGGWVYGFAVDERKQTEISVEEFIARLKGEWVENQTSN